VSSKILKRCSRCIAYPPPDDSVRDHFSSFDPSCPERAKSQFIIFLEALFVIVQETLCLVPEGVANFPTRWYHYLNAGETSVDVGTNRRKLYQQVIERADLVRSRDPVFLSADRLPRF
jgi:hypothetical protein